MLYLLMALRSPRTTRKLSTSVPIERGRVKNRCEQRVEVADKSGLLGRTALQKLSETYIRDPCIGENASTQASDSEYHEYKQVWMG